MDGDENQVMDFEARTDAAMEAFSDTTTDEQGLNTTEDPAAGTQDPANPDDPNAREQTPADAPLELTDEQRQADPKFLDLSDYKDAVDAAFAEFNIPNVDEAKLQLSDAQVLYQIARGEAPASRLLDVFSQNWQPQQVKAVANDLIGWLTKGGFIKDGQAGQPPQAADATTQRLDKIENEQKTREQQATAQREQARRDSVFKERFLPEVERLCKGRQIPDEDFPQYAGAIAELVKGNPAILKRIGNGNFVDVNRFFAQVHNAEVKRLERYTNAKMKQQQTKANQNPRIPSGGAPPAPAGGGARRSGPLTRDQRIAAATEQL